jgi:hypothetical protein
MHKSILEGDEMITIILCGGLLGLLIARLTDNLVCSYRAYMFDKSREGHESFAIGDKLIFKDTKLKCTFLDASIFEFTVQLENGEIIKCQESQVTHV